MTVGPEPQVSRECANHPRVTAVATCERCGDYACRDCLSDTASSAGPKRCVSCAQRVRAGSSLRWVAAALVIAGVWDLRFTLLVYVRVVERAGWGELLSGQLPRMLSADLLQLLVVFGCGYGLWTRKRWALRASRVVVTLAALLNALELFVAYREGETLPIAATLFWSVLALGLWLHADRGSSRRTVRPRFARLIDGS
jgi:hypothetical protein